MNIILTYWITTGFLTLLLIYRVQKHQQIATNLFKLTVSTTAQVMFLVIAFTTGFVIIPFIIIYVIYKHIKRWRKRNGNKQHTKK